MMDMLDVEAFEAAREIDSLKKQIRGLEAAIEEKKREIEEYQTTIALLLATIEKEADRE